VPATVAPLLVFTTVKVVVVMVAGSITLLKAAVIFFVLTATPVALLRGLRQSPWAR